MAGGLSLTSRLRAALDEIPAFVCVLSGPDLRVALASPRPGSPVDAASVEGWPAERLLERALSDPGERQRYLDALRRVYETGETLERLETQVSFAGRDTVTWWDLVVVPLREEPGAPPDGVCMHAVDVTRLVTARRRAEAAEHRFTTLTEANVIGVCVADGETWLEVNDAWLAIIGRTHEEVAAGLSWTDVTAPESAAADLAALASLDATGVAPPYEKIFVRPDGTRVPALLSASVLSREPLRILGTCFELTERKSAEAEIAGLLARTRRLQEITATVSAAATIGEIARAVVHNGLEELSASAAVLVRDTAVEYAVGFERERVEQWRDFPATLPGELIGGAGVPLDAGDLLEGGTIVSVALEGRGGEPLGSVALVFRGTGELDAGEHDFLMALVRQAGLAIDRIRLYDDRAYVAGKLQEGLLPERLAEAPGVEAAVVYESIAGGGEVGGDFYDFFAAADGRWTVVVGDVCGKGTEAAVITGLARHTLRAIARITNSPAALLAFLNAALRSHSEVPSFCTVACATIVPRPEGGFTATVSSGGHPFPLVLRADGTLEQVEIIGTMLGVTETPELIEVTVSLAPGDALVLYTDGVTDARAGGGVRFGEERLLATVRAAAGADAEGVAATVEDAVRAHIGPATPSADDRAILVLRA